MPTSPVSALPATQNPRYPLAERFIAVPRPGEQRLRAKQQAAFYGVVMVAYLTIGTLLPPGDNNWQLANFANLEEEDDWEDIEDEEQPLTPNQAWQEFWLRYSYIMWISWFHTSIPGLSPESTFLLAQLKDLVFSDEYRKFPYFDVSVTAYINKFQFNDTMTKRYDATLESEFEFLYVWRSCEGDVELRDIRVAQLWSDISAIGKLRHRSSCVGIHAVALQLLEWSRGAAPAILWPLTIHLRGSPERRLAMISPNSSETEQTHSGEEGQGGARNRDEENDGNHSDDSEYILI